MRIGMESLLFSVLVMRSCNRQLGSEECMWCRTQDMVCCGK